MFRWLSFLVHRCTLGLREAAYALRGWLRDWGYVLTAPFRAIRPRAWLFTLGSGIMEILTLLRLARPRGFSTEMVGSGWEVVGIVRMIVRGIVATVVSFFWLIVWSPWFVARFCYRAPVWTWYFLRTRSWLQLTGLAAALAVALTATAGTGVYLLREHRRNARINSLRRQYDMWLMLADAKKVEATL